MKKTILYSVLAALCLFARAGAQDKPPTQALKKGDALPSLTFTQLVNSKAKTIRTENYKDQLLIIDFWATWCTSCIKMFPAVEELEAKFKGKVKFLAIDSWPGDTEQKLKALFARHPEWTFPTVYGDTVATRLFPHQGVPFYVWIKNNRLLATTGTEAIDADTISAALAGDFRPYARKDQALDLNRPIHLAGNGGEPFQYIYRSLLTPFSPGFHVSMIRSQNGNGLADRFLFVNHTINMLIRSAYPQLGRVNQNRIVTGDGVDPGFFQDSTSFQWHARHRFTYEAIFSPRSPAAALVLIQEDMRRYFDLTVDSSTVERECLVFTSAASAVQRNTSLAKGKPETNWYTPELHIPITLSNYPLSEALQLFDEVSELPVLNETTSDPMIDLRLKQAAVNEQELRTALRKYGVAFRREKRKIRIYVIRQAGEAVHPTNLNKP